MPRRSAIAALLGCFAFATSCTDDADQRFYEHGQLPGLATDQWRGEELYLRYCAGCHGEKGNGKGLAAPFLEPKPRDFTRGVFKFRSTPSNSLPTEADLRRTIREGVHGTSMPSWKTLPDPEIDAIVAYLQSFSRRFQREKPAAALPLPGAPADLAAPERVVRGRQAYDDLKCGLCHGPEGKGDGPSAGSMTDSEGHAIRPFDFTRRAPKGGSRPEDLYRTFMTGLAGTPMPDYAESTRDETQRWDLVAFVLSLRAGAKETR